MSNSVNGNAMPFIRVTETMDSSSSDSSCSEHQFANNSKTRKISDSSKVEEVSCSGSKPVTPTASISSKRSLEREYDSDASWVSHVTAQSEDQGLMRREGSLDGNRSDSRSVLKVKKKKAVYKLVKMKNMFKKTFSDVDATPDAEWNTDWGSLSPDQLRSGEHKQMSTKVKRKAHKKVPFTSEVGCCCSGSGGFCYSIIGQKIGHFASYLAKKAPLLHPFQIRNREKIDKYYKLSLPLNVQRWLYHYTGRIIDCFSE